MDDRLDQNFKRIISSIDYDHYFDDEKWFADVLRITYDVITKDGFAILIEYYTKFGKKIGYSRGGIRFDRNAHTFQEYLEFIDYLKGELRVRNYAFIGMDHLEVENEYTSVFEKSDVRDFIQGTAIIYPKENWLAKFNSKKRYDLTYAGKKGVTVHFFTPENADGLDVDKFFTLVQETLQRHGNSYMLLSKEAFGRLFRCMDFILCVAVVDGEWIAYNLSIFNANKTVLERVYAGANPSGLRLRAPSFIEVKMVDLLVTKGVKTYDLWGLREGDGFTEFKKNLADEIKTFTPFSIIKVSRLAQIVIFLIKLSKLFR